LPLVLHEPLSAAQVPLSHVPPQHSPSLEHEAPSAMHCDPHAPFTQANEQQSVPTVHAAPVWAQPVPPAVVQTPAVASHVPRQHSEVVVQDTPTALQVPLDPPVVLPPVAKPPTDASPPPVPMPAAPPAPPRLEPELLSEEQADAMPTATTKHTPTTVPSFN
jgi:hypothetical protein